MWAYVWIKKQQHCISGWNVCEPEIFDWFQVGLSLICTRINTFISKYAQIKQNSQIDRMGWMILAYDLMYSCAIWIHAAGMDPIYL